MAELVYPKDHPGNFSWPTLTDMGRPVTHDEELTRMCAYGAKKFREGVTDLLCFEVMPGEDAWIRNHMAENHPDVKFTFSDSRRLIERINHERVIAAAPKLAGEE